MGLVPVSAGERNRRRLLLVTWPAAEVFAGQQLLPSTPFSVGAAAPAIDKQYPSLQCPTWSLLLAHGFGRDVYSTPVVERPQQHQQRLARHHCYAVHANSSSQLGKVCNQTSANSFLSAQTAVRERAPRRRRRACRVRESERLCARSLHTQRSQTSRSTPHAPGATARLGEGCGRQ